jgi:glutathione S-transferase
MKITNLKISHFPATRSTRVLWAAHEVADCPIEVEKIELYRGQQYTPEFLLRNPNHAVPVLDITWEDGSVQTIVESAAMVVFLADAFPSAGIAPTDMASPARADYLQMIQFGATQADMMLWQVRIHEHVLPGDQRDDRTIARYRAKFRDEIEVQLAARLSQHDFICGDTFSAADCVIGHCVTWARGYGMCQDRLFRAYISRIAKRPAFQAAFADAAGFDPKPPEGAAIENGFSG